MSEKSHNTKFAG